MATNYTKFWDFLEKLYSRKPTLLRGCRGILVGIDIGCLLSIGFIICEVGAVLRSGAPEEEGVKTLGGGERLLRLPVIGVWPGLPGHGVLEVRWQLLWSLRGLWLAAAEGTLFLVARKGRGGGSEVGRRR